MIDFTQSVIPHLEPFAGIAFALNLAYIALPRFRYRERIQVHVSKKLEEIDGAPHQFSQTDWYKGPARLATIKDDSTDISLAKFPQESWATGYSKLFEKHRDKKSCIISASALGCFLALGSAHSAGHFGSIFGHEIMFLFGGNSFKIWFALLSIAALMPVYFVYRGNGVVTGACDYADNQIKGMKIAKQDGIAALPTPVVKPVIE